MQPYAVHDTVQTLAVTHTMKYLENSIISSTLQVRKLEPMGDIVLCAPYNIVHYSVLFLGASSNLSFFFFYILYIIMSLNLFMNL